MRISLPEQVWLDYELASVGSRSLAFLVDFLLRWLSFALFAGLLLLLLRGADVPIAGFEDFFRSHYLAVLVFVSFVLEFSYPLYFEVYRQGVTPGKRLFSLRVVDERGLPITFRKSLLRTIFLAVDILGLGAVAACSMILSSRSQRLGDLAAKTLVVHDEPLSAGIMDTSSTTMSKIHVPQALYERVESFLQRSSELLPTVVEEVGAHLLAHLALEEGSDSGGDSLQRLRELYPRLVPVKDISAARGQSVDWTRIDEELSEMEAIFQAWDRNASPTAADIFDFTAHFQLLCQRFAYLQTYFPRTQHAKRASALVRAGRNRLYGKRLSRHQEAQQGLLRVVPQRYQVIKPYAMLSALTLSAAAFFAAALLYINPGFSYLFINEETGRALASGAIWTDEIRGMSSFASSRIMTNNIKVTFLAVATGISAGIFTFLLLFFNGALLGGIFAALAAYDGMAWRLFDFIVAHGFLELSIIAVAGGIGFYLGDGLISPGALTRKAAFAERCRESIDLIIFNALALVLAGLVEGYISPYAIPFSIKLGVGLTLGTLYWMYLLHPKGTAESL